MTTLRLIKSIGRSPLRLALLLILLVFACFGLSPAVHALNPPPGGGYGSGTTALGFQALFSNTTGDWNTALGFQTLWHDTTGGGNTAVGQRALYNNADGSNNVAIGARVLERNTSGVNNTAVGYAAMVNNFTGQGNTALGVNALLATRGDSNTGIGSFALGNNTTGKGNVAIGAAAGTELTGFNNIAIGYAVAGVADEDNTIRIGKGITNTFIDGINGATASGGAAVFVVGEGGKLGTMTSSARFKDEIKPMDKASEAILALKPVSFRYKKEVDPQRVAQFGLVAEDVEKINPALVIRDAQGRPQTVRYEQVNAMLLNEFLKEHRTVQELKSNDAKQEATISELRKGMGVLTAQLKEQAAQIQKVSAQLEASKPAPQVVNNP